ncbi:E3 ubiquitin-protein ligase sina-like [Aethina tumida]|uniref:E3 ubiquitin-protein ligase sina-like n=1 Tax=Aethina tumida TaxID=116153 RepID=UPI0021474229|nr:E3 ubiquitin-protein ligase sina-like [Aethina tumida]
MSSKIMYDLIDEFKCAVCFDYMKPPIRMCVTGHSCCKSCFQRMKQCPECRGKKSNFRNLNLERIYYKLVFPCENAEYGCNVVAKGLEVMKHEGKCRYGYLQCPLTAYGCSWSGAYNTMEDHLKAEHDFRNDIPDDCDLLGLDDGANCWRQVLKFDGHLFILCVVKGETSFWFGVYSLIITDISYEYELTFMDFKENRSVSFNGVCSTHKIYATEELNMDSVQNQPVRLIEGFREGDSLKYKVKIFKKPQAHKF